MNDAQAHLTNILAEHRFIPGDLLDGCRCGWEGVMLAAHDKHVAAVLLAEFDVLPKGELTEERAEFIQTNNWPPILTGQHALKPPKQVPYARLVSGWKQQP